MANNPRPAPVISERAEIHKGCKSLETLVNVLNDYCEAASAIVALQKKLAKALREAAGLKCTTEIAANALNASATIFEALSDVDTKFAKVADKECDGLSNEVKKWFKKLAMYVQKEEKAHDERIANANARIKQAGQLYEKKSKKNVREATEEHARYINLLSVLGPEMSQDKHNHALFVTQRYTSTTYNVAAALSRIADAEWLRSCEGVRRFAPTVGQLGEWRALCEGGWVGEVPKGLSDPDAQQSLSISADYRDEEMSAKEYEARMGGARPFGVDDGLRMPNGEQGREQGKRSPSGQYTPLEQPPPQYNPPQGRQQPSHTSTDGSTSDHGRSQEDGQGRSSPRLALESFPTPPKHFPLPPVAGSRSNSSGPPSPVQSRPAHDGLQDLQQQQQRQSQSQTSVGSQPSFTTLPRLAESSMEELPPDARTVAKTDAIPTRTELQPKDDESVTSPGTSQEANGHITAPKAQSRRPLPDISSYQQEQDKRSSVAGSGSDAYRKGDILDDRELGVQQTGSGQESKARATESSAKSRDLGRRDSVTSNGSIVATMRSRYDRGNAPASPPPREVPRLPLSVNEIASKYQTQGGEKTPTSPRPRPMSPPAERAMSYAGESGRYRMSELPIRERTMTMINETRAPAAAELDELSRRRQRLQELEELELREKELVLREKERELEERARELERDRARVVASRDASRGDGYFGDRNTMEPSMTGARTYRSQHDASRTAFPHRYSYSTTHLAAPASSQSPQHQHQHSRSRPTTPNDPSADHAPYCGCDRCSASKYRAPDPAPSPRDLRPPERPITLRPEKPKGWIRRLSMPVVVGNAFSLDSKKNGSSASLASPSRRSGGMADETGRLPVDYTGGISNRGISNSARR
ncbi:hypothetical protein GLOTRDRAFT_94501 [Gloeophyllum trabeum ATCC 11539]|uniref:Uncharacterized protein n=1 Tax=Gloeophyllum trabeum (strain ATCC 11539 / FP-39264 / Madison 617) TaxID=670483 RepID=S7RN30_GLOTA|nr:uncharacterized protein GLOTRDRAFT_94501 [Gloeophyllum trabeum ATCC 11539]EPQ54144.1 hypothetical protein GLOTRDRAFT_94501 [Gloeophyllum trabeum ATCC 11539]